MCMTVFKVLVRCSVSTAHTTNVWMRRLEFMLAVSNFRRK
jgi:hypothetical protein